MPLSPEEKAVWNEELQKHPLYLCDHEKNVHCPKTMCGFLYSGESLCRHTCDTLYAKRDSKGNYVRIMNADDLFIKP